jgi:hypothetical protein
MSTLPEMMAVAARKGAAIQKLGCMCSDCAFRIQVDINGYAEAVMAAAECLMDGGVFHCHSPDYQDAGKICTGFKYAKQYFDKLDSQIF